MECIILVSAPAAGKGTISKYIEDKYNISHISAGDLLRNEVDKNTEIGKKISELLNNGLLVDDDILFSLLKEKLINQKKNYILDGTPRTLAQAERYDLLLKELNINLSKVIFIEVDKEVAEKRIIGRMICKNCNSIYNKYSDKIIDNKCNKCGNELYRRDDDNIDVFNSRYETFINKTEPLVNYYNQKGILFTVTNNNDIMSAYKQIDDILMN